MSACQAVRAHLRCGSLSLRLPFGTLHTQRNAYGPLWIAERRFNA
jgi:hypothetical protein